MLDSLEMNLGDRDRVCPHSMGIRIIVIRGGGQRVGTRSGQVRPIISTSLKLERGSATAVIMRSCVEGGAPKSSAAGGEVTCLPSLQYRGRVRNNTWVDPLVLESVSRTGEGSNFGGRDLATGKEMAAEGLATLQRPAIRLLREQDEL